MQVMQCTIYSIPGQTYSEKDASFDRKQGAYWTLALPLLGYWYVRKRCELIIFLLYIVGWCITRAILSV